MDNDFTYGRHPDGHDTNTDGDWGLVLRARAHPTRVRWSVEK